MPSKSSGSSRKPFSPADVMRQLQQLGGQLGDAAKSMAEDLAKSPSGRYAEPMVRLGQRAIELSTMWIAPVRAMLAEQQDLIDAVASWAEEQRKLADRFSEIAKRHREVTEQVTAAIMPTLDHVEQLAKAGAKRTAAKKQAS